MRNRGKSGKRSGPKLGGKLRQSRIALVFGTRPEAIKFSPIAAALAAMGEPPRLIVTGQHPGLELSDHGLEGYSATPLNCPGQSDPLVHCEMVRGAVGRSLELARPELVLVQGDTSSALGGALAAHRAGVALAHVEAGLRTHDPQLPWPEEQNRQKIDELADLLFAPTTTNAANLQIEKVRGEIHVTGNSGIDALEAIVGPLPLRPRRKLKIARRFRLLVTCHRRENWQEGLNRLAAALIRLGKERVESRVILPPNYRLAQRMNLLLAGRSGIRLLPPMSHEALIAAMRGADLVLSDSGGIQEETPALGVPLLVLREKTERGESLACGNAKLVGTHSDRIVATVNRLRRERAELEAMRCPAMPFGDGRAAGRIASACQTFLADRDSARESRTA